MEKLRLEVRKLEDRKTKQGSFSDVTCAEAMVWCMGCPFCSCS